MSTDKAQEALDEIRAREQAATPGPWRIEFDSCDCGDGYGCSHGSWPYAIATSRSHTERKPGEEHDYDFSHSEISELASEDIEFIVAARADVPRLLAVIEEVLKPHQPGRIVISGALCARHENHRYFSITQPEADDVIACEACPAAVYTSCDGCGDATPFESCRIRRRITRALTGTGDSRG